MHLRILVQYSKKITGFLHYSYTQYYVSKLGSVIKFEI